MSELYKKHRPKSLSDIVGQPEIVKLLQQKLAQNNLPHALLFSGPSGCGKTTLARILRKELHCGRYDFNEVNCADVRGIDEVRKIRARMGQSPLGGKCRIWLIDEAHKLTNDAQNALLKMLEDTPNHVYFMLATTDPQKLLRTIRTRCTEISVKPLKTSDMKKLLKHVLLVEKTKIQENVLDRIIEQSEGSPRKALVFLDQVIGVEDPEDQIELILSNTLETQAIDIARALFNPRTKWSEMASKLKGVQTEEPENLRWLILGYARTILLSGGKMAPRAYLIIDTFRDHFFDSKHAGLAAACYEIVIGSEK